MFNGTFRYLMSVFTAGILAFTLAACGGDTPEPPKPEEAPKAAEDAKEVTYKCAKCSKAAKLAVGAAAPS